MAVWSFLLLLPLAGGQGKDENPAKLADSAKVKDSKRPTPDMAWALAAADLKTLDENTRYHTRYVWVTTAREKAFKLVNLTMNYISRATGEPRRAEAVGAGPLMLARIDLRMFAPQGNPGEGDLKEFTEVWEELRFDPAMNLLLTKDTLQFAGDIKLPEGKARTVTKTQRRELKDQAGPYKKDGKDLYWDKKTDTYHPNPWVDEPYQVTVGGDPFDGNDVVRVVAPYLDPADVEYVCNATHSQAPVVSHRYFVTRALTQFQGKDLFQTIYGGLYYRFVNIKKGAKKGTDLDVLIEDLGLGNVAQGVTAEKLFDRLRSDQRTAMSYSGVTSRPRRVDVFKTPAGRDSQGIISVTHDLAREDIDIGKHPLMNLLDFKDTAREVIFERPNGLHGFALYNGQGVLQDVVPQNVTSDGTVPHPQHNVLQPPISCIRCHMVEGGWRVAENDVIKLARELDIIDDLGELKRKKDQPDVIDRLVGLYRGDLERKVLPRARDDYAFAILQATGPWPGSKDQTDIVRLTGQFLADEFSAYNFARVDARAALVDLGIDPPEKDKDCAKALKKALGPPPGGLEDVRQGMLYAGGQDVRHDYDLAYAFMLSRVRRTTAKQ